MQVRHIGIVVRDLDAALRFYIGLLGFSIVTSMEERGTHLDALLHLSDAEVFTTKLSAPDGGMIELLKFSSPEWGRLSYGRELCDFGFSHVALTVKDLDAEYDRLTAVGVEFLSPPQVGPDGYAKVVFCRDPEGNFIELVENLH